MAVGLGEGRALVGMANAASHAQPIASGLSHAAEATGETLIAAHRGFHAGTAPFENTLPAFRKAIDAGADLLELDVQRTLDGVLVVHHDPTVAKTLISATALADLPKLPDGQAITQLRDVIDLAADRGARLLVELKARTRGEHVPMQVIGETVDLLKARLPTTQFEMFSFDLDAMRAVKELDPSIRTGALFMEQPKYLAVLPWKLPTTGHIVRSSQQAGVDFVALRTSLARNRTVQRVHDAGLETWVWTADKPKVIERLLRDPRVGGIITNQPQLAMDMRSSIQGAAQGVTA